MYDEGDKLFLQTRGDKHDYGVFSSIRQGLNFAGTLQQMDEQQEDLLKRIDVADLNEAGELFSMTSDEADIAVDAIELAVKLEKRAHGGALVHEETIIADKTLPAIKKFVDQHAS